jgi:site-specific recombinase XerD
MKEKMPKRRRRFGRVSSRKWPSGRRTWSAIWWSKAERRRLTRSFDTETETKEFLDEIEKRELMGYFAPPPTRAEAIRDEAVAQAVVEPPPVPVLVEYARDVIERRLEPVLAKGSVGMYRAALRAWTGYFGAKGGRAAPRLCDLTIADWLDYRAWRAGTRNATNGKGGTVGPRTLNADQQCMVRILNEAILDGHLERNPLLGLKKLREPKRPRRYLTKAELGLLIAKCPKRFKALLLAAIYTGARKSELTSLRWRDVDFEGGKISLVRSKVGNCDSIDLHPALRKELLRLRNRGKRPPGDEHVFLSWHGTPYCDVRKVWNLALAAAEISAREGLTFHSLRHSFATHFLEGGGSTTDLMAQLGHSKLETTQIYASALSERRRATVMGLDFARSAPTPDGAKRRVVRGRVLRAS